MSSNAKQPNFLLILVDDMGYSDCEPYGGEIRTPNVMKLADEGTRFRHYYVMSLCAPTRSILLTGVDNHMNGLGVMPPMHSYNQFGKKGYEGTLNSSVATIAEILGDAGYYTCMTGKWHLGPNDGERPEDRGFDRVFSMLAGGATHFADAGPLDEAERWQTWYDYDGRNVDKELPADFYSTYAYTDHMIEFLKEKPADKPFFAYLAYTAPHDPLQVPDDWLDRYKGQYDGGYPAMKKSRTLRMKDMGLIPEWLDVNPGINRYDNWDDLSDEKKKAEARHLEIYASMIELFDEGIGKVLNHLRETGEYDNTIIIFQSDNGANPKQPNSYAKITPEELNKRYNNSFDNLGREGSFCSIGGAWAEACNTPLSYFKFATAEGGVQVPLIISGPGIKPRGIVHDQKLHGTDVLPTLLDFAGVERPKTRNGWELAPLYGRSWKPYLEGTTENPIRGPFDTIGVEMIECRALIKGDWKLLYLAPPYGNSVWELYNLVDDPQELTDLSKKHPDKYAELRDDWDAYAKSVGYIKADGDGVFNHMTPAEYFQNYGLAAERRRVEAENKDGATPPIPMPAEHG